MKSLKKRALFYLTFNGVYNNNNGIGTQTKLLLEGLEKYHQYFKSNFGDFTVYIISPIYDPQDTKDYSQKDLDYATKILNSCDGRIVFCPHKYKTDEFWCKKSWEVISASASGIILEESKGYYDNLVIAVDPPYLHTPIIIERSKKLYRTKIKSLISMYSTSFFHDKQNLSQERLSWEYDGFNLSRKYKDIKIGQISKSHRNHLASKYNVQNSEFVPYESSLLLDSDDFKPMNEKTIISLLKENNIPLNKNLLLSFGRASWIKGFDILLKEYKFLKKKPHLVLIAVSGHEGEKIIRNYKKLIDKNSIECTLITEFSRSLPKALSQFKNTKAVICPSRGEPFSNIPLEVSIWARNAGPIILCSNLSSYLEQISHRESGFIFDLEKRGDLSKQIIAVLRLSEEKQDEIREKAYQKCIRERDFVKNFEETLESFWGK